MRNKYLYIAIIILNLNQNVALCSANETKKDNVAGILTRLNNWFNLENYWNKPYGQTWMANKERKINMLHINKQPGSTKNIYLTTIEIVQGDSVASGNYSNLVGENQIFIINAEYPYVFSVESSIYPETIEMVRRQPELYERGIINSGFGITKTDIDTIVSNNTDYYGKFTIIESKKSYKHDDVWNEILNNVRYEIIDEICDESNNNSLIVIHDFQPIDHISYGLMFNEQNKIASKFTFWITKDKFNSYVSHKTQNIAADKAKSNSRLYNSILNYPLFFKLTVSNNVCAINDIDGKNATAVFSSFFN